MKHYVRSLCGYREGVDGVIYKAVAAIGAILGMVMLGPIMMDVVDPFRVDALATATGSANPTIQIAWVHIWSWGIVLAIPATTGSAVASSAMMWIRRR